MHRRRMKCCKTCCIRKTSHEQTERVRHYLLEKIEGCPAEPALLPSEVNWFLEVPGMPRTQAAPLLRYLHRVMGPVQAGLLDADLLERWIGQRDEAAFEV